MKWGIVGAGAHAAKNIVTGLNNSRDNQLAGVLGSSPEKSTAFAEACTGCRAFSSYQEMLADDIIDGMFVTTPNDLHCDQVKSAAAAGKHVLVEKPMALSVNECQAMIDACTQAGVSLGVGFHMRHHPVHRELKRLITTGALGDLVIVQAAWHTRYGAWSNWRADAKRSGSDVLASVGVHVFDLMGYLAGSTVEITKSIVRNGVDTGRDATLAAALQYENGVVGAATITRHCPSPSNGIWLYGTRGMAGGPSSLGMASNGQMVVAIDGDRTEIDLPMVDLFAAQFDAFSSACKSGAVPNASGLDGLVSVALSNQLVA